MNLGPTYNLRSDPRLLTTGVCRYGWYGGATPQSHRGTGACSTMSSASLELCIANRVPHSAYPITAARNSGSSGRRASSAARESSVTNRRRCSAVIRSPRCFDKHVLVSAQAFAVRRGSAHYLTPPGDHISAVLITHRAAKQRCEKLFVLDEVVEPTQPALEGCPTSGPLVDRGDLTGHPTSRGLSATGAMCTLPGH